MSETISSLTTGELAQLATLVDVIVPRHDGMPSASDVGVLTKIERATFASRPDLIEPVRTALLLCRGRTGEAAIKYLAMDQPKLFSALMQTVAGTYFMQPDVRRLLGYPGQLRR
jgi:hypothetical protein